MCARQVLPAVFAAPLVVALRVQAKCCPLCALRRSWWHYVCTPNAARCVRCTSGGCCLRMSGPALTVCTTQVMVANIRCAEIAADQLSAFVMDQVCGGHGTGLCTCICMRMGAHSESSLCSPKLTRGPCCPVASLPLPPRPISPPAQPTCPPMHPILPLSATPMVALPAAGGHRLDAS